MSKTIDQKVVEMQFDNANFERNVKTSMSTLDKLKKSLKLDGASKGIENIQASAKKVNFSGMTSGIDAVNAKFSYMQATIQHQLNRIVDSAVNAGQRMVSALTIDPVKTGFQEYETQINAVQTILANTSHNGTTLEEVNSALDTLNTYADKTIYNFTEMTRNIGTFTAAGVDLNTSVQSIQGIANLAAVSGSTSQQASTAMYQLSQALAAGKVTLMDWNSVVNAGMGGKVFQDALIRTSELLKTGAKDAINTAGSFRESLTKSGWLTTEVLTETLKQFAGAYSEADLIAQGFTKDQAKSIADMAVTATDAATKVKTFTQLWDTLQEAAQSGWTQTWELIIGDFEQAKELLTNISDVVGEFINKTSESRNTLLEGALTTNWEKLIKKINEAGIETGTFEEKLKSALEANGYNVDELIEKHGSLEKAFRSGAVSSDILKGAVDELTGKFKNLKLGDTGEDVKKVQKALEKLNYDIGDTGVDGIIGKNTEAAIKAFQEANGLTVTGIIDQETVEALEKASGLTIALKNNLDELIDGITELGGREKIIESFKNIFESLKNIVKPISKAFRSVFPPATVEQLVSLIDRFQSLTEKMKVSSSTSLKIYKTFKGLFSIISVGVSILKSIASGFLTVAGSIFSLSGGILDIAAYIGGLLTNFSKVVKENNVFGEAVDKVVGILTNAITKIKEFGKSLKDNTKSPNVGGFLGFFINLWTIITQVGTAVTKVFGSISKTIADALGKGDIFEVLNSGLIVGILLGIKKFTKSLDDAFDGVGGFIENVTGILDDVRGCFQAYQDQLKAGTLIKIATAIAILAASLFVISTIDEDALGRSLAAIGALFGGLLGSLKIFEKIKPSLKGTGKAVTLMIGLSLSVLILASAMKKLSSLSWEEIGKGLAGVGGLMLELSIFLRTAKFDGKMTRTALGIVLLASSMLILSKAVKSFGSMKWGEIGKGLSAIGALLLEISLFTKLTGNAKKVLSTGLSMTLLAASMKIFASAMKDFGSMKWEQIGKGLSAMGGALAEMAIAMKLMPKGSIFKATGLVIAASALKILANVFSDFSGMSWEDIGKGLVVMGGALVELAIGLNLMKGTMKGSASLLIASAALAIMVPVMKTLGSLSWGQIGKGLITLAGAFTVIGLAGLLLKPVVGTIIALGAAFLLLGLGMTGIGAGLVLIGAGIASISVSLAAGATSIVAGLSAIVLGILNLVPEIAQIIGTTILEVAVILGEYAPQLAESICKFLVETVKSLSIYGPQLVDSLLVLLIDVINSLADHAPELITAFVNLFKNVFKGLVEALNGADTDSMLKGIAAVGLMAVVARLLSGIISILPSAMAGLIGVGILIAELALVLAAIGGLAQIPGLKWLITEGGDLLSEIGHALGNAIGSLISGIGEGLTSGLPQIGQNIADFMDKLAKASENASGIKSGSFDGVSELVGALGSIGLTTIGTSISDIFTLGGTSMEKFEKDGIAFFNAMRSISEASSGVTVDEASMGAVIGIATELATLQSSLEPIGGVISWFTGRDDLGTFGENAGMFIGSMKTAFESLNGATFNTEALTSIISGSTELAILQSSLEPIGGVISWFTGRDDLGTFGVNVGLFISSMTRALSSLGDTAFNQESFDSIVGAAARLATLQSSLEPIGGVISWFTGRDDLGTFGENVGQFIFSMKTAFSSLDGVTVNQEALTAIITSATSLSKLQSSLESVGGVIDWFTGKDDLGTFGTNIASFMSSMVTAFQGLEGVTINQEAMSAIIGASSSLASLQSSLENIGGVVDWFTGRDDLATFGENANSFMTSMKTAFSDLGNAPISEEVMSSVISAATQLANLQSSLENMGGVIDWFTGRDDLGTFGENIGKFADAIGKLKTGMGEDGISEAVVSSVTNAGNALLALNEALPEEGFFDSKITMSEFSDYITNFSEAISDFSSKASEIDSASVNTAIGLAYRIKNLISSIVDLDTSGVAAFTGVGTGGVGADGAAYNIAEAIAKFSKKVSDIDTKAVSVSVSAAKKLKTLIAGLVGLDTSGVDLFKPEKIGSAMKSYANKVSGIDTTTVSLSITSANRLKTFIASLASLDNSGISNFKLTSIGNALKAYSSSVSGTDLGKISSSIEGAKKLRSFISSLAGLDTSGVASFKNAVSSLSNINLGDAAGSLSKSASKFSSVGSNMITSLTRGFSSKTSSLKSATSNVVSSMINIINSKRSAFNAAGIQLMSRLAAGLLSQKSKVSAAVRYAVSSASSAVRSSYMSMYNAGTYLGSGLVSGINSKKSSVYWAGYALGQMAVQGEKDGQRSNSPSKLTIKAGKWLGEGLVIGINDMASNVYKAGYGLGNSAVSSISSTIAKISDYVSEGVDAEPTIRPVMDLSDIESGMGTIDGMFTKTLSIGSTANLNAINSIRSQRNQNGVNDDVVSAINKLGKNLQNVGNTVNNINGITYDDGSNISQAVEILVNAAKMGRRT